MRFRLRDILLLMVLLAVYFTTLNRVLQIKNGEHFRHNLWLFGGVFFLMFGSMLAVGNRWSMRKAQPIELRFVAGIPWKVLIHQVLLVISFGLVAIYFDSATGIAAFLGASMPILSSMALVFFFNYIVVSSQGIVYHCYLRPWRSVRVVRDDSGTIVALDQGYPAWVRPGTLAHRYLWPGVTLEIPEEHQQQVTELYEQGVLTNHESDE